MFTDKIAEIYNLTDSWAAEIYQELNREVELDRIKSLIKKSVDPLFCFVGVEKKPLSVSGFLEQLYNFFFYGKEKNRERPMIVKDFLDLLIKEKIFDNKEVFDRFKKYIYGDSCNIWLYNNYYRCDDNLLVNLMIIKVRYIQDELKKEIEEEKKKKFLNFLDTGLKEISEEDFLEMYKEFTDDQKALIILSITKKIEELKNIYKK